MGLSGKQATDIRQIMFRHLDGIAVGPVMAAFSSKNVFSILEQDKLIEPESIVSYFGGNSGYINVALRTLASQGWLTRSVEGSYSYALTKTGHIALKLSRYYDQAVRFLPWAMHLQDLLFSEKAETAFIKDLERLVDLFKRKWELPLIADFDGCKVKEQVNHHLDGLVVAPAMVALARSDLCNSTGNAISLDKIKGNKKVLSLMFELLVSVGWMTRWDDQFAWTAAGGFAASKAYTYGITVSYLPTFANLAELLFGNPYCIWQKRPGDLEAQVDRKLNIWSSGRAHRTYFPAVDKIVAGIFNGPLDGQPAGVVDIGCGDGSFLNYLYQLILSSTVRGQDFKNYPLQVIGVDYNVEARQATRENLRQAGIPHKILFGDVSDPDALSVALWDEYGLDLQDMLIVRTFLDHDRAYRPLRGEIAFRNYTTTGVFAYRGQIIERGEMLQDLVEHFRRWYPYAKRFGLLIMELHTIPPETAAAHLGKTLATPFDATHGYTDQYPIELSVFLEAASEAGLVYEPTNLVTFPSRDLATISLNLFTCAGAVRHPPLRL